MPAPFPLALQPALPFPRLSQASLAIWCSLSGVIQEIFTCELVTQPTLSIFLKVLLMNRTNKLQLHDDALLPPNERFALQLVLAKMRLVGCVDYPKSHQPRMEKDSML